MCARDCTHKCNTVYSLSMVAPADTMCNCTQTSINHMHRSMYTCLCVYRDGNSVSFTYACMMHECCKYTWANIHLKETAIVTDNSKKRLLLQTPQRNGYCCRHFKETAIVADTSKKRLLLQSTPCMLYVYMCVCKYTDTHCH